MIAPLPTVMVPLPCPHCGSSHPEVIATTGLASLPAYQVRCVICSACGPVSVERGRAVGQWNRNRRPSGQPAASPNHP